MRDKLDRWAFLFNRSRWANRIVLLVFVATWVWLLFKAFAITIPTPSMWRDLSNIARTSIGFEPINPWRDWLYDFQSLIGGIFAIVAAAFTVLQMRISDERSERRHKEVLQLQLRADGLRLERMYFALHPFLNTADNLFDGEFIPGMLANDRLLHMDTQKLETLWAEIEILWLEIEEVFNSSVFLDAEDLLDGGLTDEVFHFRRSLKELKNLAKTAQTAGYANLPAVHSPRSMRSTYLQEMGFECTIFAQKTRSLRRELQVLHQSYRGA